METQTIEPTTTQNTESVFSFRKETRPSLALEQLHPEAVGVEARVANADTVSPAKEADGNSFLALVGRLAVAWYCKLSGPALNERERLRIAVQMEEDQWDRRW